MYQSTEAPDPPRSVNVPIHPQDARCRYWAKIVRKADPLPLPSAVDSSKDIPGPYLRRGEDELFDGDVIFEGEERHHAKPRGWKYTLGFINPQGGRDYLESSPAMKAAMKAAGLASEMLSGSGDIAALVRIAHGFRAGMMDAILATRKV